MSGIENALMEYKLEKKMAKQEPGKDDKSSIVTQEMIREAKKKEEMELAEAAGFDPSAEHMRFGCGCGEQYQQKTKKPE